VLAALAIEWFLLLLRSVIAVAFGIAVLVTAAIIPGRLVPLVLLFGGYAVLDGIVALLLARSVNGLRGFGSLLFEALVRTATGVVAITAPAATALALRSVFGVWAILSGIAALWAASALRRDLTGEWPLPFAGAVSVFCGAMLVLGAGRYVETSWIMGPYSLLYGFTLMMLALRLRQLAFEIARS
jgi:uncharacterized membrane protein HdeD (DUF308 family)